MLGPPAPARPAPKSISNQGGFYQRSWSTTPNLESLLDLQAPRNPSSALTFRGGDNHFQFCCSGLQGHRPHMEDRSCAVLNVPGFEHAAIFAVFDGHGGEQVACIAWAIIQQFVLEFNMFQQFLLATIIRVSWLSHGFQSFAWF